MNIFKSIARGLRSVMLVTLASLPVAAFADSGIYVGGSIGNAGVDINLGAGIPDFDEDDTAWKAIIGYRFDLPSVFLSVEGGYANLGEPTFSAGGASASVEATGMNLFGVAGLEAGPIELFVKAGYIAWDADLVLDDGVNPVERLSDDGSDMGYGLGLSFGLGPVSIRGEYEKYDIEDADVSMISVGFTYLFD